MSSRESQPIAFVAMSYDERLKPVYLKVVRPVLADVFGYHPTLADEVTRMGVIVDQIRELIEHATLILCDLTFHNPNVFYELGIAHTLGKQPILISQDPANIAFDTRHLRIIPYEDSKYGLLELRDNLVRTIEQGFGPDDQRRAPARERVHYADVKSDLADQRVALYSNSVDMRRWAIKFLGDNRDQDSFDKIRQIAVSSDISDLDVKRDAFTALYNIDNEKARNLLIGFGLRSQRDYLVRERVVDLLGNYPPDEELIEQMRAQATDSSWGVRRKVCEVLGRWEDERAIPQLRMMLSDSEPLVSMAAVEALNRFSARQVEPDLREEAQEALDRIEG